MNSRIQHYCTLCISVLLLWSSLWSLLGKEALPGGHVFALLVVVFASYLAGEYADHGVHPQNVPVIDIGNQLDHKLSSLCRSFALIVILLRAGSNIDPVVLKKLSFVCFRLGLIPCLVEAASGGVVAHYLLELPWLWSFMMGFVLAAVSPAVVVPCMLTLKERGLGIDKGIPTLVIAAVSLDNVLAITAFGVFLGVTFSTGSITWTVFKGPVEVIVGVAYGTILGCILWYLPQKIDIQVSAYRFVILLLGGFLATFVGQRLDFGGMGAIGCLTLAFVATLGWRRTGDDNNTRPVIGALGNLWIVLQPALFGLIGAELKLDKMDLNTIGQGCATICVALFIRLVCSFLTVMGAGLSIKEKIFVSMAWFPKATVQAAIGPVALDYTRRTGEGSEAMGIKILTVAVLSILLTAPIGALAIMLSAPKILKVGTTAKISDSCANLETTSPVDTSSLSIQVGNENIGFGSQHM